MSIICLASIGHHLSHIYEAAGLPVQVMDSYTNYKLYSKSDSSSKLGKPSTGFVLNSDTRAEPAFILPYLSLAFVKPAFILLYLSLAPAEPAVFPYPSLQSRLFSLCSPWPLQSRLWSLRVCIWLPQNRFCFPVLLGSSSPTSDLNQCNF